MYLLIGVLLLHGLVSGAPHDACFRSEVANRYSRCKSNPLQSPRQAASANAAALHVSMTHARLSLTPICLLRMHRITWELKLGMVCTPGMPGTA